MEENWGHVETSLDNHSRGLKGLSRADQVLNVNKNALDVNVSSIACSAHRSANANVTTTNSDVQFTWVSLNLNEMWTFYATFGLSLTNY